VSDILLFDVVKDFADGACHAVPTCYVDPCKEMAEKKKKTRTMTLVKQCA